MASIKVEIIKHKEHKFMFLNDYLWMWDTPQEKELQEDLSKKSFGDVLVAGYGLGILPKYLLKNPKVKSVTTVEIYKEVIKKMKACEGGVYGNIIIGDYYKISGDKKYDCIIGDIWPDIDAKFLNDYIKFKKKSQKLLKKNGKLLAWGKDYFEYLLKKKK
jgi:spermidine synthase